MNSEQNNQSDGEDRVYITAKAAEPLRAEYKDLSKSVGALAASLRQAQ